ncbi:MAG: mechanosensitive ion channel protein [Lysobacterales bacterium]|jgi:small conductance mechanosensitive channel|nr:MAG: mechanosensitive ion channel protein [Xanthomonadales bacterium]
MLDPKSFAGWLEDPRVALVVSLALRLLIALFLIWLGFRIARWAAQVFQRFGERTGLDPMLAVLMRNGLRLLLPAIALIPALDLLGVPIASLLTVLAAAGLAVGLALRDSLANVAGAVMLVTLRPFRVGDFVSAGGITGVVEAVDIFHTRLRTPDNRLIAVPNRNVANADITNFTARERRRIDLPVGIAYGSDLREVQRVLIEAVRADGRFLSDPPPDVLIEQFADSSINLTLRVWVPTSEFIALRSELAILVKETLDRSGIAIPFPQREVRLLDGGLMRAAR